MKWLCWGIIIAGVSGFLAVELGWIVTEEGRQPWIIYNLMRVSQAANPAPWMTISFIVFSIIYILLGITLVALLLRLARQPKTERQWTDIIVDEQEIIKESLR